MYCHACGQLIPSDAAYCPRCGATQRGAVLVPRRSYALHPAVIALALVFFFPLGLILMWSASDWDPDLKWAITGLIFPPIWLRFLWKIVWLPPLLGAGILFLVLRGMIEGGLSATAGIAILIVAAVILLATMPRKKGARGHPVGPSTALREAIDDKLHICNDLITDIERTVALDLIPADSPIRQRYARALEMRSEGIEIFQRASAIPELVAADDRISQALNDLRSVRDGLPRSGLE